MARYKDENRGKKEKGKDGLYLYSGEYCENGGIGGFIYKNSVAFHEPWRYKDKNEIVYIPEYGFPDNKSERVPASELQAQYIRQDIVNLTNSEELAAELFDEISWQHPENLWNEWCADSDKNGYWIEARWAYEKVYLPEFAVAVDRKGQEPVCGDEFFNVEWQDEKYRNYCLKRLTEIGCISKEDARVIKNTLTEGGNGMTEQIDYRAAVAENATQEFNDFYAAEMEKTKEEIFGDYYKIHFYNELKNFLTDNSETHKLDADGFRCLYEDGKSVLACLYDYYLKNEYASTATWEDIGDFINNYNEKYYSNILGGAELG